MTDQSVKYNVFDMCQLLQEARKITEHPPSQTGLFAHVMTDQSVMINLDGSLP